VAGAVISSAVFIAVTLVYKSILSKAYPFSLAVAYIIAVKKDIGLNKYDIHKLVGVIISLDHLVN